MQNVPSSALLMTVAVVAAVLTGGIAFAAMSSSSTSGAGNEGAKANSIVAENDYAQLDGETLRGADVIGYIDQAKDQQISILVTNGSTTREYNKSYDMTRNSLSDIADENDLIISAKDNGSEYYIEPTKYFKAEVVRSPQTNEIMQIRFTDDGTSSSYTKGHDTTADRAEENPGDLRTAITLRPNYPLGRDGNALKTGSASTINVSRESASVDYSDQNLPELTCSGHVFKGWNYNNTLYTGTLPGIVINDAGGSIEMTAKWEKQNYNITYSLNGGNIDGNTNDVVDTKPYESDYVIDKLPTRDGYSFAGYAKSATGNIAYNHGDSIAISSDVHLYAIWTQGDVTVTFNANGGSGSMTDQTFHPGTPTKLSKIGNNITHPDETSGGIVYHYTFAYWSTTSDGTGTRYADGISASFNADTTLYAIWNKRGDTCRVTYNLDGGKATAETVETYKPKGSITLAGAVTKDGYEFKGWNIGGTVYPAHYTYPLIGNITATATWKNVSGYDYTVVVYNMRTDGTYPDNDYAEYYTANSSDTTVTWKDLTPYIGYDLNEGVTGVTLKDGTKKYVMPEQITLDGTDYHMAEDLKLEIKSDGTSVIKAYVAVKTYKSIDVYANKGAKITEAKTKYWSKDEGPDGTKDFSSEILDDADSKTPVVQLKPAANGVQIILKGEPKPNYEWIGWANSDGDIISSSQTLILYVDSMDDVPTYRAVTIPKTFSISLVQSGNMRSIDHFSGRCDDYSASSKDHSEHIITTTYGKNAAASGYFWYDEPIKLLAYPAHGYQNPVFTAVKPNVDPVTSVLNKPMASSDVRFVMPATNLTLTAAATPITYHIEYDLNQGTSTHAPQYTGNHPLEYTIVSDDIAIGNPTMEGWRFVGWTVTGSAKNINYDSIPAAETTINSSTPQKDLILKTNTYGDLKLTANWEKDVTLTLYSGANKAKKNTLQATVTSINASKTFSLADVTPQEINGFTAIGWRPDGSAASQYYNPTGTYTVNGSEDQNNWTLYAVYNRVSTFYSGTGKSKVTTATQYYNTANNYAVTIPSSPDAISGWTALGWRSDTNASSAQYSTTGTITASAQVYYAVYNQSVTLSYAGNGNTGGSTTSHSATRLYNTNGATYNPTLNLKSNGFTKTNYHFTKWDLGAAGTAITMNGNKTAKAQWAINTYALTVSGAGSNGITADVYIGGSKVATNATTFSKTYNHGTSWKIVFHRSGYKDQTFSGTLTAAKTQSPGTWESIGIYTTINAECGLLNAIAYNGAVTKISAGGRTIASQDLIAYNWVDGSTREHVEFGPQQLSATLPTSGEITVEGYFISSNGWGSLSNAPIHVYASPVTSRYKTSHGVTYSVREPDLNTAVTVTRSSIRLGVRTIYHETSSGESDNRYVHYYSVTFIANGSSDYSIG